MEQKIKNLILQHKEYIDGVSWYLNKISAFDLDKVSFEDAKIILNRESYLKNEYNMRSSFISDLENLLVD